MTATASKTGCRPTTDRVLTLGYRMRANFTIRIAPLLLALLGAVHGADAQERYILDQHFGSIGFSVSHLGLFSSQGEFRRFEARLVLDAAHPDRTQISVTVNAASLSMPWRAAAEMLRSDDFFNVQQYPYIRFTSTSVSISGHDRYAIRGTLQIRGVKRPLTLMARLIGENPNSDHHDDIGDFIVTGSLDRAAFGMRTDEAFISNLVDLVIKARLALPTTSHAG
jgi:polyisoprenoid-binding protein YceI